MSSNPSDSPISATDISKTPPDREHLATLIELFLADELTSFEFDEQLDAFDDVNDLVIQFVTNAVWYHYDDCDDHLVCLSKPEWDYFQRLLLLLRSDCQIETSSRRIWSIRQILAASTLSIFIYFAIEAGWGHHLLVLAIPFGVISMLLAYIPRKTHSSFDPYRLIIHPFATFSDLEAAYHSSAFRKTRYPKHLSGRTIRSPFTHCFHQVHTHIIWLLLSPFPLLFQTLPKSNTDTKVRIAR